MIPSFGIRVMLVLITCAPAAGVFIAYAGGGASLWTAVAFAILLTVGTLLFAWWLMGKTGVRRDLERARARERERERGEDIMEG
jgi:hypothetical protein